MSGPGPAGRVALLGEARAALEALDAASAEAAEAYRKRSVALRIQHRPDAPRATVRSVENGLALRAEFAGGRRGFGATSRVEREAAAGLAAALRADAVPGPSLALAPAGAREGSSDAALPSPDDLASGAPRLAEEIRRAMGARGRAAVRPVRIEVHTAVVEVALAGTTGFEGYDRRTLCYAAVDAVADGDGERRGALLLRTAATPDGIDAEELAELVARRASAARGGEPCPTGSFPVVIDADAAADLLQEVAVRWVGPGAPGPGETVAAPGVDVVDDGRLPGGPLAAPFDGEGTPTCRTTVVERGVLRARLLDREAALAAGLPPTGNGVRHSFRDPPASAPTHLAVAPGSASAADLVAGLERGLYVTNLRAAASPASGGLAALVEGVWVEGGRAVRPVSRGLMTLPRRELLLRVRGVGSDLRFHPAGGAFGSPTLLVEPVTLSG